eukprot:200137_1
MWLKYCLHKNELEIITLNKNYTLIANDNYLLNKWYNTIRNLFRHKFENNVYYNSNVCEIKTNHNQQTLKNRHIALFKGYLVIFQHKKQLNSTKTITFFSERIFA